VSGCSARTVVLLLVAATGCDWGTVSRERFRREFFADEAPAADLFEPGGLRRCLDQVRAAAREADPHAVRVWGSRSDLTVAVVHAGAPPTEDEYRCRGASLDPPERVKLSDWKEQHLEDDIFALSEVDADLVPGWIAATPGRFGVQGGKVTGLDIRLGASVGNRKELVFSIAVSVAVTSALNGSVEYDEHGKEIGRNSRFRSDVLGADLPDAIDEYGLDGVRPGP
jgi:hypothetical protein